MMYDEYVDRVSEVVTGIVQQAGDRNNVLVDLGKVEALLPRSEQVDGERYEQGSRIKAVITEVRSGTKGPQVILSRRDPELIKTLFELEVPEIADGLVEIRGVAREPGYRSKIAVESHAQGVDPVGACVGPRGSRVRMVVSELRGEKIDIIPWNPEPARFVAKALSPARVREVFVDDETKEATVIVPDDQLALAIGKEGSERPARRTADRLEGGHPVRHGVRAGRSRSCVRRRRRRRGVHRPVLGSALERQALSERGAARLPLLRPACAPGARAAGQRQRPADRASRRSWSAEPEAETSRDRERRSRRPRCRRKRPRPRSTRSPLWRPSPCEPEQVPAGDPPSLTGRATSDEPRSIRPLRDRADQELHRVRPQGAAARVPAVRGEGRSARSGARASRVAAPIPAGGSPASSARSRAARSIAHFGRPSGSSQELASLYT